MLDKNVIQTENAPESVPYIIHESSLARAERQNRRFFVALIISIILLFASNGAWLIYEGLFDTMVYQQDGDGLNNINTGEQGDLNPNESESKVQAETQP